MSNNKSGPSPTFKRRNVAGDFRWYQDGHIYCNETDRVVAKFSHGGDAKGYCELLQKVQQLELAYNNIAKVLYCDICNTGLLNCEC
jgi:hypothetical protein